MKQPTQTQILNLLRDTRFNTLDICKQSGVSRNKVVNLILERSKTPLSDDELQRLWDAIPDKRKSLKN